MSRSRFDAEKLLRDAGLSKSDSRLAVETLAANGYPVDAGNGVVYDGDKPCDEWRTRDVTARYIPGMGTELRNPTLGDFIMISNDQLSVLVNVLVQVKQSLLAARGERQ